MFDDQDDPFKEYAAPSAPPKIASPSKGQPIGRTKLGHPLWDERQVRKAKEIEDSGYEITATTNGKHMPGSSHGKRSGFDIRTKDLHPDSISALQRDIGARKGAKIVYERPGANVNTTNEHLHYDFTDEEDDAAQATSDPFAGYSQTVRAPQTPKPATPTQPARQLPPQSAPRFDFNQRKPGQRFDFSNNTKADAAKLKVNKAMTPAEREKAQGQQIFNRALTPKPGPTIALNGTQEPDPMPQPPGLLERAARTAVNLTPGVGALASALGYDPGASVVEGAKDIPRQVEEFSNLEGDWSNIGIEAAKGFRKAVRSAPQAAATLLDIPIRTATRMLPDDPYGAKKTIEENLPLAEKLQPWTQAQDAETDRIYQEQYGIDPNKKTKAGVIGGSVGSSIPLLAGGAAGLGAKGVAAIGAGMNAQQVYAEARSKGATPEEASRAATIAAPIGALEGALGVEAQLGKLGVNRVLAQKAGQVLKTAGKDLTQEEVTQLANNLNASTISGYDKDRKALDGVVETAIGSLGMSGAMGGAGLASRGVNRVANAVNVETPPLQSAITEALDHALASQQRRAARSAVEQETRNTADRIFEQVMAEPVAQAVAKQQQQSQVNAAQNVSQAAANQADVLDGLDAELKAAKKPTTPAAVSSQPLSTDATPAPVRTRKPTAQPVSESVSVEETAPLTPSERQQFHLLGRMTDAEIDAIPPQVARKLLPQQETPAPFKPETSEEVAYARRLQGLERKVSPGQSSVTPEQYDAQLAKLEASEKPRPVPENPDDPAYAKRLDALTSKAPEAKYNITPEQYRSQLSKLEAPDRAMTAREQEDLYALRLRDLERPAVPEPLPAKYVPRGTGIEFKDSVESENERQVNVRENRPNAQVPSGIRNGAKGNQAPQSSNRTQTARSVSERIGQPLQPMRTTSGDSTRPVPQKLRPDTNTGINSDAPTPSSRSNTAPPRSATPGVQKEPSNPISVDNGPAQISPLSNQMLDRAIQRGVVPANERESVIQWARAIASVDGRAELKDTDIAEAITYRQPEFLPDGTTRSLVIEERLRENLKERDVDKVRKRDLGPSGIALRAAEILKAAGKDAVIPDAQQANPETERRQQRMRERAEAVGDRKKNVGPYGQIHYFAERRVTDADGNELQYSLGSHPEWSQHLDITPDATTEQVLDAIAQDLGGKVRSSELSPEDWATIGQRFGGNWSDDLKRTVAYTVARAEDKNAKWNSFVNDRAAQDLLNAEIEPRGMAMRARQLMKIAERYNDGQKATNISESRIKDTLKEIQPARTQNAGAKRTGEEVARRDEPSPETQPAPQAATRGSEPSQRATASESAGNRTGDTERPRQSADVARAESNKQQELTTPDLAPLRKPEAPLSGVSNARAQATYDKAVAALKKGTGETGNPLSPSARKTYEEDVRKFGKQLGLPQTVEVKEEARGKDAPDSIGELVYSGTTAKDGVLLPRDAKNYNALGSWFTSSRAAADELYSKQGTKELEIRSYAKPEGNLLEAPHQDFNRLFGSNIEIAEKHLGTKASSVLKRRLPDTPRLRELERKIESNQPLSKHEVLEVRELRAAENVARQAINNAAYMRDFRDLLKKSGYNGIVWRKSQIDAPKSVKDHDVYLVFHDKDIQPLPKSSPGFTASALGVGAFAKFNDSDIPTLARHFVAHAKSYGSWARAVLGDLGARVRPHLQGAWKALQAFAKDQRGVLNEQAVIDGIKNLAKKAGFESNAEYEARTGTKKVGEKDVREKYDVSRTSVNQVPALMRVVPISEGSRNIDIGGGKFERGTETLAARGVKSQVLDPYSRSAEHNAKVEAEYAARPADTATVANVLNVISDPAIRKTVIKDAGRYVKAGGKIYFDVYEGNGKGTGAATSVNTWQENRKLASYLPEIQAVYPDAKIERANGGRFIVATRPEIAQLSGDTSNISSMFGAGKGNPFSKAKTPRPKIPVPEDFDIAKMGDTIKEVVGTSKLSKRQLAKVQASVKSIIEAYQNDDGASLAKHQHDLKQTLGSRWWIVADILRPLNATGEISVIGRQGFIGWATHPILSGRALKGASASEGGYWDFVAKFANSETRKFAEKAGVDFGLSHEIKFGKQNLSAEENTMVSAVQKIPFFKHMERYNKTFIDGQRMIMFEWGLKQIKESGKPIVNEKGEPTIHAERWAKEINRVTGRGNIAQGRASEAMDALSVIGYSPRFTVSRFQALNPARLVTEIRHSPTTAKIIAKDYAKLLGVSTALALLGVAAGFDVNIDDPDDMDFLVLKRGNWRIAILQGGMQAQAKYAMRMLKRFKEMGSGEAFDKGKGIDKAKTQTGNFLRYKEAPVARVVHDQLFDRRDETDSVTGKKVNVGHDALGRATTFAQSLGGSGSPIFFQQLHDAYQQEGLLGMVKQAPEFVGASSNIFQSTREPLSDAPDDTQTKGDQVKPRWSYAQAKGTFAQKFWMSDTFIDKATGGIESALGMRAGYEDNAKFQARTEEAKKVFGKYESQLKNYHGFKNATPEQRAYLMESLQRHVAEESNTGEKWTPRNGWISSLFQGLKQHEANLKEGK